MRRAALAPLLLLAACATRPAAPTAVQFLAFGDHGYSLDYLDAKDYTPPRTEAQFIAEARVKWLKERRPAAEFTPPPIAFHNGSAVAANGSAVAASGSAVAASGMMPTAGAMDSYCGTIARCQFAVMLGDNIYPDGATHGADGRDDARRFQDIFTTPFGKFGWGNPDFRIYGVLGNHDWHTSREAALAQVRFLETTRPFHMAGLSYTARPVAEVEVFALDTHVLLGGLTVLQEKLAADGSEIDTTERDTNEPWAVPMTPAERTMVADLETRLRASTARWKIVIGHHPLWSSAGGKFQQSRALRAALLPTLCRHADLYFAGHEHTLEIATDDCRAVGSGLPPLPAIVTGAAGKQRPLNTAFMAHQARNNPEYRSLYARGMVWGFTHVSLAGDTATITMLTNTAAGVPKVETVERFRRRSASSAR